MKTKDNAEAKWSDWRLEKMKEQEESKGKIRWR